MPERSDRTPSAATVVERRLVEVLREVEEILSDATSSAWAGDGALEHIQKARDLIGRTLKPFEDE